MKTNAPGPFSCEIYLKSWQLGYRTGDTKLHIDNCYFCGPIVHGGTEDFPLSAADQAKKNIADRKRASRRRFFTRTATAASIAGITVLGLNRFVGESETAGPNNGTKLDIAIDYARLDTFYSTIGRSKIELVLATGTLFQVSRTLLWIGRRRHASMYDLLCLYLGDGRKEVQKVAYASLNGLDRASLKPHAPAIGAVSRGIKDRELLTEVRAMLVEIESS